ncbi:TIGR02281 family clan AA aspartic protease [Fulvimarina endophytica]|uniref:TIGR02281 family clan AA aspartic protease n=1 Tax=Fulvimarina endophytica TaxID=2293836 RepID=A0A371X6Y8_9HYPH|nr:TIGR02281 family clan AA aspartic protease [Fulvimarina endophytica]RFC64977.1 TIGR02281 family clan AA aspartic protease [Fulvimarina endophytica]
MLNRAIVLLSVCSFGGLAIPSVYETYVKDNRAGLELVEPKTAVVEANIGPDTAAMGMTGGPSVTLDADASGHFVTKARLNGMASEVLIDTGASRVAIPKSVAARIGIYPAPGDWTAEVKTANGTARAARARIDRIEIGPIAVRGADALILEDGALGITLIGMSFLSELKRYSVEDGRLTMVR